MVAQALNSSEVPAEQQRLALIGRMTSGIVHDARNIMTVIRCNAELAEVKAGDANRYLGTIVAKSDQLLSLLEEVLAFARGDSSPAVEQVDLAAYLEEIIDNHAAVLQSAGIETVLEVETETATFDPLQVSRAVQNLIGNAVDAMPEGGQLTVRASRTGDELVIAVTDTGCGMAAEHLACMFDPFFTHGKVRGTGLGAAIVKSVATAHDGRVEARSQLGAGTTVSLTLRQPPAVTPLVAVPRRSTPERPVQRSTTQRQVVGSTVAFAAVIRPQRHVTSPSTGGRVLAPGRAPGLHSPDPPRQGTARYKRGALEAPAIALTEPICPVLRYA